MLSNEPLIKYGPFIILICTIVYWALLTYLEEFLYEDENE